MSLIRHSAWAAAAAITLTASRFLLAAVLARRLTQAQFGQYAYGQWLVDLSFLLCSFGVAGAASRYVAEYRHDPGLLTAFIRRWRPLAIGLPFLTAGGVLIGASLSGLKLTSVGLALLAVWGVASGLWAMQTAALIGMQRFDLILKANAVGSAIMLAGALLLPQGENSSLVFGLMAVACSCGASVGLIATNRLGRGGNGIFTRFQWRSMGTYAVNIWISVLVASLVWSRGELPIVKAMLGDLAVAHYAAALAFLGAAVQGIMLGVAGVAPHLTGLWGGGRKEEAIALARTIMDMQLVLSGVGSLFIIFFGGQVVSIAFTDSYRDAADLLSILCFGLISFAVSSQSQLLQLETDARFNRNAIFFSLAVLYALALALIPKYGLAGAATARIGAMLTIGVVTVVFVIRRWGERAVSIRNTIVVLGVLSGSLFLQKTFRSVTVGDKLPLFVLGLALLVVFVRDVDGNMVVRSVFRRLATRFF